jgi:hypothetical protein
MALRYRLLAAPLLLWLVSPGMGALAQGVPTPPIAFVGITPCRLADTRGNGFSGAFGPPTLAAQSPRVFPVAGNCGIPPSAQAVSANLAVTNTSGVGFISVWPEGAPQPVPLVASMNYAPGQTIANAVLAPLGASGGLTVYSRVGADLIFDVNGYFVVGAAGPPGATGPQGPGGAVGPPGGPGPDGFSSIARPTFDFTAVHGTISTGSVFCTPPNSRVIGGGAEIKYNPGSPNSSSLTFLNDSHPADSGNGWMVRVRNNGNTFDNPVTVYAICAP